MPGIDQLLAPHQKTLSQITQRHQILASNLVNADTPGYKATDIRFANAMSQANSSLPMARSNPGHMSLGGSGAIHNGGALVFRKPTQPSIDGNTVDVASESAQFADNSLKFEAALKAASHEIKIMKMALDGN